jgi:formate hydrogenlyase subunit 3/multisubunit Na+/H+ antiporter MnhD subunit
MLEEIPAVLLLLVIVWPLLLAIPLIRARLPWPRYLSIIPAAVLVVSFQDLSLVLPSVLLGIQFAIGTEVRWILTMLVVVWFMAAVVDSAISHDSADDRHTTFFMLTLAGNLGTVLAADLVAFFSFSTLMGYGFYGLLMQQQNQTVQRAARLYVILLVIADLALFEALLLAAFATEDLRFIAVQQSMAGSGAFYLWMVVTAFALRAGIWPFHFWLTNILQSASRSVCVLVIGAPVAMAMLGFLRWLPIGFPAYKPAGVVLVIIGITAIIFGIFRLFSRDIMKIAPAWVTIVVSGLFIAFMGACLIHPALWSQSAHLAYPFIAGLSVSLVLLILTFGGKQDRQSEGDADLLRVEAFITGLKRWNTVLWQWSRDRRDRVRSFWRELSFKIVLPLSRISCGFKNAPAVSQWTASLTLFLLLGLALIWLAK